MNLISAIAYALLVYGETHGLDYYLLRAAIRVDDILSFSQINAVTTEALRRHSQNLGALFAGMELTILISMFAAMMVVLLFLRVSPSAWYRVIMGNGCFGFLALFALPVSYLRTLFRQGADNAVDGRYTRLFWLLLAADVLCAVILFLASRVRAFSMWASLTAQDRSRFGSRHEYLISIHSPPGRHYVAHDCGRYRRHSRLQCLAGSSAAAD